MTELISLTVVCLLSIVLANLAGLISGRARRDAEIRQAYRTHPMATLDFVRGRREALPEVAPLDDWKFADRCGLMRGAGSRRRRWRF